MSSRAWVEGLLRTRSAAADDGCITIRAPNASVAAGGSGLPALDADEEADVSLVRDIVNIDTDEEEKAKKDDANIAKEIASEEGGGKSKMKTESHLPTISCFQVFPLSVCHTN